MQALSKNTDEKFDLAHKVVEFVDSQNGNIWVILLRYNVEKQSISYAQV